MSFSRLINKRLRTLLRGGMSGRLSR